MVKKEANSEERTTHQTERNEGIVTGESPPLDLEVESKHRVTATVPRAAQK